MPASPSPARWTRSPRHALWERPSTPVRPPRWVRALSWSPSTGSVAGYTLHRDGSPIAILYLNGSSVGTARSDTTTYVDENVTPLTTYTYAVDAFDGANDHSAQSAPLTVITPVASPE